MAGRPLTPLIAAHSTPTPGTTRASAEQRLVDTVIALMEQGTNPWRRPWDSQAGGHHRNLVSGRRYRGANPVLLALGQQLRGSSLPYWCGFVEAKSAGLVPRRGARAVAVLRPQVHRRSPREDDSTGGASESATSSAVSRQWVSYRPCPVFNAIDLVGDGLAELIRRRREQACQELRAEPERLGQAESVLGRWDVEVCHGGAMACYQPEHDRILLPERQAFHRIGAYYATWAHEAIHSTGHPTRLGRDLSGRIDGDAPSLAAYAREELVAELGAALLGDRMEIGSEISHHAAYLDHWVRLLRQTPTLLYRLLSEARRAADLILPEPVDPAGAEPSDLLSRGCR